MTIKFFTNAKQYGNNILYAGFEGNKKVFKKIPYKPSLFLDANNSNEPYVNLDGNSLTKIDFDSIKATKEFVEQYKDVDGYNIYGNISYNYAYLSDMFRNQEIVAYDSSLIRIFLLDIEVVSEKEFPSADKAKYPITAITLYDSIEKVYNVWGLVPEENQSLNLNSKKVIYREFTSEVSMLTDFVNWWVLNYPDIVSGWNSSTFDIPYIINRIINILGEKVAKKLSPWGILQQKLVRSKFNASAKDMTYDIYGISELDYLQLYKKFTYGKLESYKLNFVAKFHLGKGKVEYEGSLYELYYSDFKKFMEYNIGDVELLVDLDADLQYMNLVFELSYAAKCNYSETLGTTRMWECLINCYLANKNIYPKIHVRENLEVDDYEGGYVKVPQQGKFGWLASFDAASLYPSIIRHVNIGIETYVPKEELPLEVLEKLSTLKFEDFTDENSTDMSVFKKYNLSVASNLQVYRRDKKSFSSELMEYFFNKRKEYKAEMLKYKQLYVDTQKEEYKHLKELYDMRQYTVKIFLNSFYGSLANKWFQFYRTEDAEAVTLMGQCTLLFMEKKINTYMNKLLGTTGVDYVIYMDTDSLYINLDGLVKKFVKDDDKTKIINFLDKACSERIQKSMDSWLNSYADYTNAYENHLFFKREAISEAGVWLEKKKYFLNVWDMEGTRYKSAELKATGVEMVRSSTPMVVRKEMEDILKIFLEKDNKDLIASLERFEKEFKSMSIEEISSPRGINDIEKYNISTGFVKGTPIHVRGAIVYNRLVESKELQGIYPKIGNGDKIKYVYLKEPNPTFGHIISYPDKLPKEFGLEKYVDYKTQYEKVFMNAIKKITATVGWKNEDSVDITDFF